MEAPLCRNLVRIQTGNGEHGFRRLFSRAVKGGRFKIYCILCFVGSNPTAATYKKKNTNSNLYSETIKSQSFFFYFMEHKYLFSMNLSLNSLKINRETIKYI